MFFYTFFSSLPELSMPALCPPEINIDKDEIEKLQKEVEVRLICYMSPTYKLHKLRLYLFTYKLHKLRLYLFTYKLHKLRLYLFHQ